MKLVLDAVMKLRAQRNSDVGGREVAVLAADECLGHGGYRRGKFREGVVHPHRPDRRGRREPTGKLADGLQELCHPGAVRDDMVPRHANNEAAAAELGHLHQQQRRVRAVPAGVVHGEVVGGDHRTRAGEPGLLQVTEGLIFAIMVPRGSFSTLFTLASKGLGVGVKIV